jgi:Ca-activated chloride channel family protein
MNCQEAQGRLTDALLDEAGTDERQAVLEHAEGCAACAGVAEQLRQTLDLLREADWPAQSELRQERRRAVLERALKRRPAVRWPFVLAASGAAAAALAVVAVPSLLRARVESRPPEPTPERASTLQPPPAMAPLDATQAPSKHAARPRALGHLGPNAPVEEGISGGVAGGIVGGAVGAPLAGPRDMFFEHRGTNPWVAAERDWLSSFGLDVDTASYTLTRSYIRRGLLPPPEAVRVEEFVNAQPQDYRPPAGGAFGIHLEAAHSPFAEGHTLLRVGIRAKDVLRDERRPAHLTFVVDVSGSMRLENRLGLVRRTLRLLVERLDERDWIGLVVYGTSGRVVLRPTPVSERETILEAIESLEPEGSTNLEQGLELGYQLAVASYDPTAANRVVLCTDGVANNGVTDASGLLARIRQQAEKGIDMIALGFGMGNYNDALLQRLADEGDGQYAYIDDYAEAKRFFLRELTGVLETVARDARAQVEFDPRRVERYRLIGYEKRDIADEDFRNDAVDAGEVNAGQTVTVLYELALHSGDGPLGTVRLRFADPHAGSVEEIQREIPSESVRPRFQDASAGFQLSVLAARFAEHLRRSRWLARSESLQDVLSLARALPPATARTDEARDLVGLIQDAMRLSARSVD